MKNRFLKLSLLTFFITVSIYIPRVHADTDNESYNIILKETTDTEECKEEFKNQGIKIVDEVPEIKVMTISTNIDSSIIMENYGGFIESISRDNSLSVEPNITYSFGEETYTNNEIDFWQNQWDMQKSISTNERFLHKSSGKAVIGVVDSGITYDNSEISSNIISVQNFTESSITGVVDCENILDKTGHGTSVIGQISSSGQYTGIAPGMKIRMYKVFEEGNAQDEWILKALVRAARDDVDVINLSLGQYLLKGSSNSEEDRSVLIDIYQRAINYAHSKGSIVVASVGDEGVDLNDQAELKYLTSNLTGKDYNQIDGSIEDIPAELDNVVTVGSIDKDDEISSFSNYGRDVVDIYAVGGGSKMLSTYGYESWISNKFFEDDWIVVPTLKGKYTYGYGTSIATPKVSAALGLIIEKYDLKNQPDKAINILYNNARSVADGEGNRIRLLDITNFL